MNNSQKYTNSIDAIAECLSLGASEFVISTGARNAEIIYSILSTKNLDYYSHPDERSASFFALGRCISSNSPVVMITTSGTAVAELYPACIEAYYQSKPLILLTADRPIEYQGSGAPQSINQINIFISRVNVIKLIVESPIARTTIPVRPEKIHVFEVFRE